MKLPWLQSVPLHGADPVPAVDQDGGGCTEIPPWAALSLLISLMCLWWGGKEPSQWLRNLCELCNLWDLCRVKSIARNGGLVIYGLYKVFCPGCFPAASLLPSQLSGQERAVALCCWLPWGQSCLAHGLDANS